MSAFPEFAAFDGYVIRRHGEPPGPFPRRERGLARARRPWLPMEYSLAPPPGRCPLCGGAVPGWLVAQHAQDGAPALCDGCEHEAGPVWRRDPLRGLGWEAFDTDTGLWRRLHAGAVVLRHLEREIEADG